MICVGCRNVQDAGVSCGLCGGHLHEVAPALAELSRVERHVAFESSIAKLKPRKFDTSVGTMVGVVLAGLGLSVATLSLVPAWIGIGVAVVAVPWVAGVRVRGRTALTAARLPELPPAGTVYTGVVRAQPEMIVSPISGERCVAASVALTDAGDRIYLRRAWSTPFWIELQGGTRVLVDGEVWLELDGGTRAAPAAVRRVLGVDVEPSGPTGALESVLRSGAQVTASGRPNQGLAAGEGYRDEEITILRGEPGRPVVVRRVP